MKRIIMLLFVIALLTVPCFAEEYSFSAKDLNNIAWDEFLSSLPEDAALELDGINPTNSLNSAEKLGEKVSFSHWIDRIVTAVKKALPALISSFAPVISILIITSAANTVMPDMPRVTEAFGLCSKLALSVVLMSETVRIMSDVTAHMTRLCTMMNFFLPVMEAVSIAGGNVTEKSVTSAAITLAVTLIGNVNTYFLTPLVSALFSLSVVSLLSEDMSLAGAVSSFRKFVGRMWQICTILFSFILGIQTILAKGTDNLVSRGAKFAIGSFVPVAGGMLSEAFGTVREGMNYLREVCGIGGIIVLLSLTVPVLVPMFLYKAGIFVTKTAANILKCGSISSVIEECGGVIDMLLGVTISVELMFLFAILLFTKSW